MNFTSVAKILLPFLLLASEAKAQNIAYSTPMTNINVDGILSDWPEDSRWYNIDHYYGSDRSANHDLRASFSSGYNIEEKAVYIAVRVVDDEPMTAAVENSELLDEMLLYFDLGHRSAGGSPVFFEGADSLLFIAQKPGNADIINHSLNSERIKMARTKEGNVFIYEWKITIMDEMSVGSVFGLDFMIVDYDRATNDENILLWKDGFGKSYGSQKLGDLMLLDKDAQLGQLRGTISMDTLSKGEKITAIDIVAAQDPKQWVQAHVDSLGNFQVYLPEGEYELRACQKFTSPINSTLFNQNTRKLKYSEMEKFLIYPNKTTSIEPINIGIIPRPDFSCHSKRKGLPIETVSKKEVDAFINQWKDYFEIPAVSVALIRENEVFYEETIGVKDNVTNEAVNEETLFEAASITKSVFATMVLKLAERNVIDLDKPLYQYLPFPSIEKDERSKLITARIVLGHQTGLPNWIWGGPSIWEGDEDIELIFEPGTNFKYSGEGVNYLGRVIEHITKKDLETIYKEEIETPFNLTNSYFLYRDDQEERFALGHFQQYIQIKEKERRASPASSLGTNAHFFKNFVLGLMNENVLDQSSYELIYTPHTQLKEEQKIHDPEVSQYVSHGFFVQESEDGKLIAHGGNNGDYDSYFAYNPDKKFAFIIFTNSNLGDEFARAFQEYLLGKG